jgi:tetratricopeptide (TPR) repeat protein
LVQVGMQAHADRYMYWPMIGLLIMGVWSIPPVARMGAATANVVAACCGLIVIALSVVTWAQVARWKNTQTLFTRTLAVTEDNFIAHNTLGAFLRRQGNFEPAVYHLERALDLHPQYPAAHNNLGLLYMATGDYQRARQHFEASLAMQPLAAETWTNLGVVNFDAGQTRDAATAFLKAIELDSQLAKAHAGLGTALWAERRVIEALPFLRTSLELNDSLIDVRMTYGVALASQEQFDDAIQQFEIVLKRQPDHATARQYLEAAKAQRGLANTHN